MKKIIVIALTAMASLACLVACDLPKSDKDTKDPNVHVLTKREEKEPTCTATGYISHYYCDECGRYFADENANEELKFSDVVLTYAHDYSVEKQDSLSVWKECSKCGAMDKTSRKPLQEGGILPDISKIDKRITIGVGERKLVVVGESDWSTITYTPLSWNQTIARVDDWYNGENVSAYYVYGVETGTTIISCVDKDGKTLCNQEITVVKDDTVRIESGNLIQSVEVDKTQAVLYYDDTAVTYTVKTSAAVEKLVFSQITTVNETAYTFSELISKSNAVITLDEIVIEADDMPSVAVGNKKLGTCYTATRREEEGVATWTVQWDLGATAVRFIRVSAWNGVKKHDSYVHLDITYPVFEAKEEKAEEDFVKLMDLFIRSNSDTPLLFKTDSFADGSFGDWTYAEQFDRLRAFNPFAERFIDTLLWGDNAMYVLEPYDIVMPYTQGGGDDSSEKFNGKNILCGYAADGYTLGFYYPISNELRAIWAYKYNFAIDKDAFPYAHAILEKASAVIDEIIRDGMTDFEKERAIYTWMYELGMDIVENGTKQMPDGVYGNETLEYMHIKTAYGLLEGYGGDCMAWSSLFHTLCNMVDVDCVTISLLTVGNGEIGGPAELKKVNHRANIVRLDNEYYFVESFWAYQKTSETDGAYRYMNMTWDKAKQYYYWSNTEQNGPEYFNDSTYLVDEHTGELLSNRG